MKSERTRDQDRCNHAYEWSRGLRHEVRADKRRKNHYRADDQSARLGLSHVGQHLPALGQHVVGSSVNYGPYPQHYAELRQKHHGPDAAGKADDDRLRDFLDKSAEFQNPEHEHEYRSSHADFGRAPHTLTLDSLGDKRYGCARSSSDEDGISAQQSSDGSSCNGCNETQHWREPHHAGHGQTIRKRDKSSYRSAGEISSKDPPIVGNTGKLHGLPR